MSNRYKGGIISATPPTTSGGNDGVASGAWTLEQQMQAQAAGLWPNQPVYYIEDVFSTWLYTGNGSTQTITNGIDLSTKGGMVWLKSRTDGGGSYTANNYVFDTIRGSGKGLQTNVVDGADTRANTLTAFGSSGFSLGNFAQTNFSGSPFASWTFREQPKFFDVVTWTGTGVGRTISHNLGSAPGCMIIKRTDTSSNWTVYHRSLSSAAEVLQLETTGAAFTSANRFNSTAPSSTVITLGDSSAVNASGGTYVAYLFAHNAGGFGLTSTDNVVSCGSYTGNASFTGPVVTLGYEPQWVLIKRATDSTGDWKIFDIMRGIATGGTVNLLEPNTADGEVANNDINVTATGFNVVNSNDRINASGSIYIYIAIRRGPMKVPTSGTSVFTPVARTGTGSTVAVTTGIVTDMAWVKARTASPTAENPCLVDRLRGDLYLQTDSSTIENSSTNLFPVNPWDLQNGFDVGAGNEATNFSGRTYINWAFKRAPSFFDVVCYTGTGVATSVAHNLQAAPELLIIKKRAVVESWWTWCNYAPNSTNGSYGFALNSTALYDNQGTLLWGSPVAMTSTGFSVGAVQEVNSSGTTYVAHLFASCPGVSKVGSYTGTAATLQIDCGFTAGTRFVLIKRTDSAGSWYLWDSARGIVAGNDPYLLNSSAAEVTNTDYVDTYSAGFELTSTASTTVNISAATYIFLAIA